MMDYTPDIVQVVPHEDYTVSVYFCDGKIVLYDATGTNDPTACVDIDPDYLYSLEHVTEQTA